uniref:Uncharacterized protein n=1 Tax=Rhizophora mucronata TaxID=61149 RepID=A0A2P2M4Z4_RHIMU
MVVPESNMHSSPSYKGSLPSTLEVNVSGASMFCMVTLDESDSGISADGPEGSSVSFPLRKTAGS